MYIIIEIIASIIFNRANGNGEIGRVVVIAGKADGNSSLQNENLRVSRSAVQKNGRLQKKRNF